MTIVDDVRNSIFLYMLGAIMTESVIWSSYIDGATFFSLSDAVMLKAYRLIIPVILVGFLFCCKSQKHPVDIVM